MSDGRVTRLGLSVSREPNLGAVSYHAPQSDSSASWCSISPSTSAHICLAEYLENPKLSQGLAGHFVTVESLGIHWKWQRYVKVATAPPQLIHSGDAFWSVFSISSCFCA